MAIRCANLYDSLFIENDGYIYPCFRTRNKLGDSVIMHQGVPEHVDSIDPARILQSDGHAEMRAKMANGSWPAPCSGCRMMERNGGNSPRRDEQISAVAPKHIHIRVGNKCNLRCVMCGPGASNQWYDEYPDITGQTTFDVGNFVYNLRPINSGYVLDSDKFNFSEHDKIVKIIEHHSDFLETMTFHGGEPLLSKSHNKIIRSLAGSGKAKNIDLSYHTNLTILPAVLAEMKEFRSVHIMLSLDGVSDVNDAVRWPSKYETIMSNLDVLRSDTDFKFSVNHTICNLNYEHLPNFLAEMDKLDLRTRLNPVYKPIYASASIYDDDQKSNLLSMLGPYVDISKIRNPMDIRYSDDQIRQHRTLFNKLWDHMVKKQDQDWERLFPFAAKARKAWNLS